MTAAEFFEVHERVAAEFLERHPRTAPDKAWALTLDRAFDAMIEQRAAQVDATKHECPTCAARRAALPNQLEQGEG